MATIPVLSADPRAATVASSVVGRAERLLAVLAITFFVAYPVGAFVSDPALATVPKIAWLAALVLGCWRPAAGAALLLATPLLPAWPLLTRSVPHGIVHLLVLSQAIPWLFRAAAGRRVIKTDAVGWSIAALLITAIASLMPAIAAFTLWFDTPPDALRALHDLAREYVTSRPGPGYGNVFVAATAIGDLLLVYLVVRSSPPFGGGRTAVGAVAAVAAVVSIFGLVQLATGWGLQPMWLGNDPLIVRVNSTFADPNALAAYLALVMPIAAAVVAAARSWPARMSWAAAGAACGAALVATAGRVGYVGALLGLTVLVGGAIGLGLDRLEPHELVRRHFRRVVAGGLIVLLLAGVTFAVVGTVRNVRHSDQDSYVQTVLYTLNMRLPLNERLKGRIDIWRTVVLMIRDRPWFGAGIGSIYTLFPYYNRYTGAFAPDLRLSAHNTFLNITAELGIVGLVTWLALLAALGATAVAGVRRARDPSTAWIRLGLAAGLAAYATTMISGDRTILREDLVMLGIVAALCAAGTPPPPPRLATVLRWTVGGLAVALLLSLPARVASAQRGVPLERVSWGFHDTEQSGGVAFRWTTGSAMFHVPAGPRRLVLPLRSLAPFRQRVQITFNGRLADDIELRDHNWTTLEYVLPRLSGARRYHRVELRVSPVWQPPADPRVLGVMIGAYQVE